MNNFSPEFFVALASIIGGINIFLTVWFIRISESRITEKLNDKQRQIDFLSTQIDLCFKSTHRINERIAKTHNSLDAAFKVIAPKHLTVPKFRGE